MRFIVLAAAALLAALSLVALVPLDARKWIAAANLVLCGASTFVYTDQPWPPVVCIAALGIAVHLSLQLMPCT